jgi:hypothetical protein
LAHGPNDDILKAGADIGKLGAKYLALAYARGARFVVEHPIYAISCLAVIDILFILGLVYLH